MSEIKKYKYSGKWTHLVLGLLLFGSCIFFFYFKAINNNQRLVINNIIELDIASANIFYWIFFSLSALMTLTSIFGIYFKSKKDTYLVIDASKIIIPPIGFQRKHTVIHFIELSKANEIKINGNHILTLYFGNKKKNIVRSLFSKKNNYNEFKNLITSQLNTI